MADENPLRLPPPIIGNPYIGDVGRGKLSDSPDPRRPAIPFVLWYGEDAPVSIPPSTDTPPRPTIVTADGPITAPMVGYNIIKTMVSPPVVQWPPPVVVGQQQSLNQLFQPPFVFVERPPSGTAAAPIETPARPLVVKSLEAPTSLPEVFAAAIRAVADTPLEPIMVRAVELPSQQPFVFVERPPSEPPAAPVGTPEQPVMVRAVELPWTPPQVFIAKTATADQPDVTPPVPTIAVGAGMVGGASAFVNRAPQPPVVIPPAPPKPTVVSGQLPPPATWRLAGTAQAIGAQSAPGSTDAPMRAVVVPAGPVPQPSPFVLVAQTEVDPPAAAPAAPSRPTVVAAPQLPPATWRLAGAVEPRGAQSAPAAGENLPRPTVVGQTPQPQTLPFVGVAQPKVFAAAPVAGDKPFRPLVVGAGDPPQPVDQVVLWAIVSDWQPPKPTIVDAGPVPVPEPFTFIAEGSVDVAPQPPVPIAPVVVKAQPFPPEYGQVITRHGFADAAAPTETPVPIRPTVVAAQPVPPQYGQAITDRGFAVALPPPEVPPKPIVINAQPLPTPYVQAPWISYTEVDPPKVPVYPTVVGQQPIPPQAAFVSTPDGGRWGDPPPRIITPTVTTDLSLPFRPNGWVRVAHGFAEALPTLFEGSMTGGIRDGASISGGVVGGAGVTGQARTGYVTGGVR